jgi:hypothetical protein
MLLYFRKNSHVVTMNAIMRQTLGLCSSGTVRKELRMRPWLLEHLFLKEITDDFRKNLKGNVSNFGENKKTEWQLWIQMFHSKLELTLTKLINSSVD